MKNSISICLKYRDGATGKISYRGTIQQAKTYAERLIAMDSYNLIKSYQISQAAKVTSN